MLAAWLASSPSLARADAAVFQFPLDPYPLQDGCLEWGGQNPNFPRCGMPGRHVADDACAPNGTPVLAVADGTVRFAAVIGSCFDNWGWVMVVEHVLPDLSAVCSIYGHCAPRTGIVAGIEVARGTEIAAIDNPCLAHIHFGVYRGSFAAPDGEAPIWLLGYLPDAACAASPVVYPGAWVDPVRFVLDRVAVEPRPWSTVKLYYR
jgi:murein DD-endopeptidase MepM/ murein hydrolase activator NlpD